MAVRPAHAQHLTLKTCQAAISNLYGQCRLSLQHALMLALEGNDVRWCLLQMMIVTEPTMVTQALDRQLYPEFIDKPSLYNIINQVQASLALSETSPPYGS